MDDRAPALTRAESLPTLPSLEEAQARLAAGLPSAFARFAADLFAHPDPDESSHFGRAVPDDTGN